MAKTYDIPSFSDYQVEVPFQVRSLKTGRVLTITERLGKNNSFVRMIDDEGKRRQWSIITVAALAFHGQPPRGKCKAYHTGGDLTPKTVFWISKKLYHRRKRSKLKPYQKAKVVEEYMSGNYTQDELAKKYNIGQVSVSRIVRQYYEGETF